MRWIALTAAISLTMLPLTSLAQQQLPKAEGTTVGVAPATATPMAPNGGMVPQQGSPLHPGTQTGLDVVAEDGVSTKTVKAVPCTTAARETDGTTTCVGIPSGPERKRR